MENVGAAALGAIVLMQTMQRGFRAMVELRRLLRAESGNVSDRELERGERETVRLGDAIVAGLEVMAERNLDDRLMALGRATEDWCEAFGMYLAAHRDLAFARKEAWATKGWARDLLEVTDDKVDEAMDTFVIAMKERVGQ